jgi:beta-glucosidase/6-phospho-beta-glucosidase/beta-galactosidase
VKGVFAWSLFDGFEFNVGMQIRFGLYFVDHSLKRYARKSALWFKAMLINSDHYSAAVARSS